MAGSTHGTGGLAFDASKRARPQELNVLIALVAIVAAFELLGRVFIGDSFLFNTRDNVDGHLQPATAGDHHPAGVDRRHHRRRRHAGDHNRRDRFVVGFRRRRDRHDCNELRAGKHLSACRLPGPDGYAGHCSNRGRPRVRLPGGADQRPAGRIHKDSVLHCHPRHDGDGARRSQVVVEGSANLISRPNPSRGSARASCPF